MTKPDFDNLKPKEWEASPHGTKGDMLHVPSGETYRLGEEAINKMVRKPEVKLYSDGVKTAVNAKLAAPAEPTKPEDATNAD